MIPVILAGGPGSRLWPQSRAMYPKQFLSLHGEHTMLQQTLLKLQGLNIQNPVIVCNQEYRFLVAEQLRQIGVTPLAILLEPVAKNTAPAITLAATYIADNVSPNETLLVLPADLVAQDQARFQEAIKAAEKYAAIDYLVTFGIKPQKPETSFGYINCTDKIANSDNDDNAYQVNKFDEKPDLKTATRYIESSEYYWNGGIYACKASKILEEMSSHAKDVLDTCKAALGHSKHDLDFIRVDEKQLETCPSVSFDYAILEKTTNAAMVILDAGWSDIGSWSALWELEEQDNAGNVVKGDTITKDTTNCFLQSNYKLLATLGVDNIVVVDTPDAILVANKDQIENVADIVEELKSNGRKEYLFHREVYRPWGRYDSIDTGERFQVKRITVNPGAKLSVQMHHHRAEHWIVVSGTAKVSRGDEDYLVSENQSTYIPLGTVHALENPGKIPLEMIEVQSGTYLGEDDIVRLQDKYGRA